MKTNKYGICHLSTIPVRASFSHRSEIVTQLVFGEIYQILEASEDKEWIKIRMEFDGYEGWIPENQKKKVSKAYFKNYQKQNHPFVLERVAQVQHPKYGIQLLSAGSVLPFLKNGKIEVGDIKMSFLGATPKPIRKRDLICFAKKYLRTPYLWGGRSIFGIDCSGFAQQVFKTCLDINLPRDAYQQAEIGEKIPIAKSKEGDLAFFKNAKGRITHVGIVMKKGRIIHASGEVRIDELTKKGIIHSQSGEKTHDLAIIKRIGGKD
ncbi:MAG: hypothetical protein ACI85I_001975 [Arenicella sp.]|jgi:hypothetical protein